MRGDQPRFLQELARGREGRAPEVGGVPIDLRPGTAAGNQPGRRVHHLPVDVAVVLGAEVVSVEHRSADGVAGRNRLRRPQVACGHMHDRPAGSLEHAPDRRPRSRSRRAFLAERVALSWLLRLMEESDARQGASIAGRVRQGTPKLPIGRLRTSQAMIGSRRGSEELMGIRWCDL
jgi:hypothetical protein